MSMVFQVIKLYIYLGCYFTVYLTLIKNVSWVFFQNQELDIEKDSLKSNGNTFSKMECTLISTSPTVWAAVWHGHRHSQKSHRSHALGRLGHPAQLQWSSGGMGELPTTQSCIQAGPWKATRDDGDIVAGWCESRICPPQSPPHHKFSDVCTFWQVLNLFRLVHLARSWIYVMWEMPLS